jgi:hypothetical protein
MPAVEIDVELLPPTPVEQPPASRGWLVWLVVLGAVLFLALLVLCGGGIAALVYRLMST